MSHSSQCNIDKQIPFDSLHLIQDNWLRLKILTELFVRIKVAT